MKPVVALSPLCKKEKTLTFLRSNGKSRLFHPKSLKSQDLFPTSHKATPPPKRGYPLRKPRNGARRSPQQAQQTQRPRGQSPARAAGDEQNHGQDPGLKHHQPHLGLVANPLEGPTNKPTKKGILKIRQTCLGLVSMDAKEQLLPYCGWLRNAVRTTVQKPWSKLIRCWSSQGPNLQAKGAVMEN